MQVHLVAGLVLVLALLSIPSIAQGQANPQIDWASVLTAESDARVSVDTSCTPDLRNPEYTICVTIANSPPPNFGYAMTDLVSYGDLAGDGQTDAVIPLDSGGTVGISGFLVYRIGNSTPQLIVAQSGYGGPNIDTDTNTLYLLVKGDGPNCCPTSMDRTSYKLVGDSLVEQGECTYVPSPEDSRVPEGPCTPLSATQQTTAPTAPRSSSCASIAERGDFSCLKAFGGPVLMPPARLEPFASLPFVASGPAENCRPTIGETTCTNYPASYSVYFSDPNQEGPTAPSANVSGAISSQMQNDTIAHLGQTYSSCAVTASYCANQNLEPGCTGIGCLTQGEVFRGLTTRGDPALVQHVTGFSSIWEVDWFDSKAGVSYWLLVKGQGQNDPFGTNGVAEGNTAAAQQITALADKLVLWDGSVAAPAPSSGPLASVETLYQADWSSGLNGWTGTPDWKTVGRVLINDASRKGQPSVLLAPYRPSSSDYAVEAEIQSLDSGRGCCKAFGILVRGQDAGAYAYKAGVSYQGGSFLRITGGAADPTALREPFASTDYDPGPAWHTYRVEVRGNTVKVSVDGVVLLTPSDNQSLTGTQTGLWIYEAEVNVRGFTVLAL